MKLEGLQMTYKKDDIILQIGERCDEVELRCVLVVLM